MQLFAQKYPDDTRAVVVIDSFSRNQNLHDPAPPKSSNYYREAIAFDKSRAEVKNSEPFPSILLIILTATNHHESEQREEVWQKWQREITQISPKSMQIFAWGSGHYIQKEQPQLVLDAIYTAIQLANPEK